MTPAGKGASAGSIAGLVAGIAASAAFVAPYEGWRHTTYWDKHGQVNTVCAGNLSAAIPGATFTDEECGLLLISDVVVHVLAVSKLVTVPLDEEMLVGLTSFSYNLGWNALRKSTLLRKLNSGDRDGAGAEFGKWVLAGGKQLPGLVIRRAHEARLFLANNPTVSLAEAVEIAGVEQGFAGPSPSYAPHHYCVGYTCDLRSVGDDHPAAAGLDPDIVASVAILLGTRRPAAVIGTVPSVVVDSIDGQSLPVRRFHVGGEGLECRPAVADAYPAAAVPVVVRAAAIAATLKHPLPYPVNVGPIFPVAGSDAATICAETMLEATDQHRALGPAVAAGHPSRLAIACRRSVTDHGPAAEPGTDRRGAARTIAISHCFVSCLDVARVRGPGMFAASSGLAHDDKA